MKVATVTEVLALAKNKPVQPERGIGCCRVYVSVMDKAKAKEVAKAAKALGMIFQKKGYAGATNVLYVGYDNCDGRALARGAAVVDALNGIGIECYRDEYAD